MAIATRSTTGRPSTSSTNESTMSSSRLSASAKALFGEVVKVSSGTPSSSSSSTWAWVWGKKFSARRVRIPCSCRFR